MHIRGVDFPESLIRAQKEGRLVVFAGAGVSMPNPSNYPNFDELAEKVSAGVLSREKDEPVDRFLGRLADKNVRVHERVLEILTDPASAPNPLHSNLLRLFDSKGTVRLVTTNFDSHFTNAALTLFDGKAPEVYSAPALPLGDSFQGIVYLHGSVEAPSERLVLTDTDFGLAYLTQGWARRFLQGLFAKYTVLFVGYSHRDIVMEYLARGLPPQTGHPRRFVLTMETGDDAQWIYRGIKPFTYPRGQGENEHAILDQALAEWVKESRRSVLEHEEKIRSIVQRPLSVDIDELDYVEASLSDVTTVCFFTRYAKTADWLTWIENKEPFVRLFRHQTDFNVIDSELSDWFVTNFVVDDSSAGLAVVYRKKQVISRLLATVIAQWLFAKKPRPTAAIAKWIPLLISPTCQGVRGEFLEYILAHATFPEEQNVGLILFHYLTKPEICLKENIWKELREGSEDVTFEVQAEGDEYWLETSWAKLFRPNFDTLGDRLVLIVSSNLERADLLLRASGRNTRKSDHLSFSRGMIESTGQGSPSYGIGLLIDAARDLIEWVFRSVQQLLSF